MAMKITGGAQMGHEDDARDLFQEAIIVMFEKVREGEFDLQCKLSTYLFAVMKNLWMKKQQQNNRMVLLENMSEEAPDVESDLQWFQTQENNYVQMKVALEKLGEPCKGIIIDYYLQKKSMLEIRDKYGYTSADNAKTQKYKCLNRLKKLFFSEQANIKA